MENLNYRYYILMVLLPMLAICSIRSLRYLSPCSVIANAVSWIWEKIFIKVCWLIGSSLGSICWTGHCFLLYLSWPSTSLVNSALGGRIRPLASILWHGHFCHWGNFCRTAHWKPNEISERYAGMEWSLDDFDEPSGGSLRGHGFLWLPQVWRRHCRLY